MPLCFCFQSTTFWNFSFYTQKDLPPQAGGPFTLAFDKESNLGSWLNEANKPYRVEPDWSNVVHEEERFWTWTHEVPQNHWTNSTEWYNPEKRSIPWKRKRNQVASSVQIMDECMAPNNNFTGICDKGKFYVPVIAGACNSGSLVSTLSAGARSLTLKAVIFETNESGQVTGESHSNNTNEITLTTQ